MPRSSALTSAASSTLGNKHVQMNITRREGRCKRATNILVTLYALLAVPTLLCSQTFTENLTRIRAGEGMVTLHQDEEITALVNGQISYAAGRNSTPTRTLRNYRVFPVDSTVVADSTAAWTDPAVLTGRRVRMNGFRIQLYAGSDNRKSKAEAYRIAASARAFFTDLPVYTHFVSPRWVCHVGDFKTREEASEMLAQIRQTGAFGEAFIVKTKIIAIQ